MLFLGMGYMVPFNVLITATDYYDAMYPEQRGSMMYYIVPIHRVFLLLSLGLMMTDCLKRTRWHFVITIPFLMLALSLSAYPYLDWLRAYGSIYFLLVLLLSAVCGLCGGAVQCAVTSFCNHMPSQYMKASISGQAMAGIAVCSIKIAIKASPGISAKIYFVIAGVVNALCAVLFVGTMNTKLVKHHLNGSNTKEVTDYLSRYDAMNLSKATQSKINRKRMERERECNQSMLINQENPSIQRQIDADYGSVFEQIKSLSMGTFLVMMTTFLFFPGLECDIKSQYELFRDRSDWFSILLIFEFNIFDFVGRQFLSKFSFKSMVNPQTVITCSVLRALLLYPSFFILNRGYIVSDILLHSLNVIAAASNGYLISIIFGFLSQKCLESAKDRKMKNGFNHISASIMTLSLNLGIFVGSVAAIAIKHFLL